MKREALPLAEPLIESGPFPARSNPNARSIEILHVLFLRGPSIWTYRPLLEAWVDIGELEDFPSNTLPGLYERLSAWLPTLIEHQCTIGERGGFLQRLREGTWSAHILEHVMIELQNLSGIPSSFGQARETSRRGVYKVVVRTPHESFGRAALFAARDLLMAAIDDRPFDVAGAVAALREKASNLSLTPDAACIVNAAYERRIPWVRLNEGSLLQLGYGSRQRRVWMGEAAQSGAIAEGIAEDQELTRTLLQSCGLPVMEEGDLRHEAANADNAYRLLVVGARVVVATRLEDGAPGDVSKLVHPEFAAAALLAVRILGLEIAGVHIAAEDIAQPMHKQRAAIVRVEARPGLQVHGGPDNAISQHVGHAIVDHLMAKKDGGRIPVVGITGSHGMTSVARLVAKLIGSQGTRVGLACSDGLYLGNRRIEQGDCARWESAQRLLRNPLVDAAVCENSYRAIVSEGLGYDRCKVGVVTNLDPLDTLPDYDISDAVQMEKVVRTQVDVVLPDGVAVLNAADAQVAALAPLCDGEVIYFGTTPDIPAIVEHRSRNGRAVFFDHGKLVFATGSRLSVMPFVPGEWFLIGPECLLAAAGAAWALDIPLDTIRRELAAGIGAGSARIPATPRATPLETTQQQAACVAA